MPHETSLIATIAIGLAFALIGGLIAARLRLPPLVGYLLAGIAVGPFTPGFVADVDLAPQLAEIGVILLMFGVGVHFSIRDLMSVRRIALPGALAQIGEFSFILAGLGVSLGVFPAEGQSLIVAGALLSISLHSLVMGGLIFRMGGLATGPPSPPTLVAPRVPRGAPRNPTGSSS